VNNLSLWVQYLQIEMIGSDGREIFLENWVMLSTQLGVLLSFFFWAFVTTKVGKRRTYYLGAFIWILAYILLSFVPIGPYQIGDAIMLLMVLFMRGFGAGVGYLIPMALLPDVIELDFQKYGNRREGTLYSLFIFFQKLGLSVAVFASNIILTFTDFEDLKAGKVRPQDSSAVTGLRIMCTILPAICIFLGCCFVYFCPEKQAPTAAVVVEKDNAQTATDNEVTTDGDTPFSKSDGANYSAITPK